MTQLDLNGNEHKVEFSGFPTNGRTLDKSPAQNPAPADKPLKPLATPKTRKPVAPDKAPAKPAQPPVKADKKVTDVLKHGKVETSLTPAEKTKRQAQLESITSDIRKETSHIANSYLKIGYKLWLAKEKKLYAAVEVDGKFLKNIYEYGQFSFGFKKSSIINFIAVCEKFSLHTPTGLPTDQIDPAFSIFGYTQLSEMLSLSDDKLSIVSPEMTRNDIKSLKSDQPVGQSEDSGESDTEESLEPKVCFSGVCNEMTWDSILDKLDNKCRGHKVVITWF